MSEQPVWITGLGATTPLGSSFQSIGDQLLAGQSAARFIIDHNTDGDFQSPGCLIDEIPVPAAWTPESFRKLPRIDQATLWSCDAALKDSGWKDATDGLRVGIVLGLGGEWLREWQDGAIAGKTGMYDGLDPENLVRRVQSQLNLQGPTNTVAAACASANYAFALGRQWVARGFVDICLAGGVEIVSAMGRSAFHNLRALSCRSDDAKLASRPFDRDRDGFVMGEGAAILLLESSASARRRSARVYGEVAGFGSSSDAFHMIIPGEAPGPVASAIGSALAAAKVEPCDVNYVNAHATGTPVGDVAESRALNHIFGSHTKKIPVSSTKSITGHLLSAAAGIEAIAGLVALDRQAIPPTINLENPDPQCNLCHVANQAIDAQVDIVVSNSFGFGGNNTSLVLRRVA